MPKLPSLKAAKALLEGITSAEQAVKLVGPEREAYLKALEAVHGPSAKRSAEFELDHFFHGTHRDNLTNLRPSTEGQIGPGVYVTKNKEYAKQYGDNIHEVRIKGGKPYNVDEPGADTIGEVLKNPEGIPGLEEGRGATHQRTVFDPSNIRSVDAAFDPRFKKSKLLMAGATGAALGTTALAPDQAEAANPLKTYKVGRETFAARNMGEAYGITRKLQAEGKVGQRAKVGEVILEEGEQPSTFGKVTHALGAPQRKMFNTAAGYAGVPTNEQDAEPVIHDLVQAGADKLGLPENDAMSALKAGTVAVGSVFADPLSLIPIGKAAQGLGKIAPAVGPAAGMLGDMSHARMPNFAEGGEVDIPDDQVVMAAQPNMGSQIPDSGIDIPDDEVELDEDKYGTDTQMAITALEGAATGIAGPLATLAQTKLLGMDEKDILGRREENPITHGVGQAVGLTGSVVAGGGLGSLAARGAAKTAGALGLGAVEGASLGYRVGSAAVREAAEMAILSSANEIDKFILNDPNTSAESAIANIGLGTALGGAGGAFAVGAMGPLWNATAGPQVEKLLGSVRGHLDGTVRTVLPEDVSAATKTLGLELDPVMKAALGGDQKAVEMFTTLKYAQNPKVMQGIEKLETDVSESVMNSLGIPLKDAQVYSKNEAGTSLGQAFKKEFEDKFGPIEKAFDKRNLEAVNIGIGDDARLAKYGQLIEKGMKEVGTDSPMYKLFDTWGERLLAKETIGGIDQLKTEIGNDLQKAYRAADYNTANALKTIRRELEDFQENQITRMAQSSEKEGITGAAKAGEDLLNERAEANRMYKEFAGMSNELLDHLGAGNFKGAKTLMNKIESVGPEGLLNKFSVKNNADFIPFLAKNFPETLQHVRQNELKSLIQPAINRAKGESPINVQALSEILKKTMAGKKELAEFALSPEALAKIEAAARVMDAIPKTRDSGTAGGLAKIFNKMPQSAMAAIGMLTGGNPVAGYLAGEMSQRLGRNAPDAIRLAYLKFLGSDQPIKAEGFKAMVDFMTAAAKGEHALNKSVKAMFKAGAQVIPSHMPTDEDNEKLDKKITAYQKAPDTMMNLANGNTGHYMPNHQGALAVASTKAIQYLQSIKPQPHKIGPLDKEVPPQPSEIARYNRALSIANNPSIVLDHVKKGTILVSDLKDLNSLYPALYKQMSTKIINEMTTASADEETIPYHTRMGISLFLGSPVDMSMQPMSIQAAQPKPQPMGQQQAGGQGGNPQRKGQASKLGKTNQMYQTPLQAAASDRSERH